MQYEETMTAMESQLKAIEDAVAKLGEDPCSSSSTSPTQVGSQRLCLSEAVAFGVRHVLMHRNLICDLGRAVISAVSVLQPFVKL